MKTKLYWIIPVLIITIAIVGLVLALPILPNKAIENANEKSPVTQLSESELTKVVFIRYAPRFAKDKPCNGDGICDANEKGWCGDCKTKEEPPEEPTSTCYGFLSGAKPKWKWTEDYYYSTPKLGASSLLAITKWNDATSATIFGDGVFESNPWGVYDYKNSILFGDYPEEGVIGVTAIWFQGKTIYEYDIMYDTDYFPGSIDLDTVVLHELGHGAGLDDLYDTICSEKVMYWRYEGVKSDLRSGDIAGIQKLYG